MVSLCLHVCGLEGKYPLFPNASVHILVHSEVQLNRSLGAPTMGTMSDQVLCSMSVESLLYLNMLETISMGKPSVRRVRSIDCVDSSSQARLWKQKVLAPAKQRSPAVHSVSH